MSQRPSKDQRLFEARATLAVAESNERIERAHEQVACPSCGAPIGTRCWQLSGRGKPLRHITLKHPHRKRWTLVVPAR